MNDDDLVAMVYHGELDEVADEVRGRLGAKDSANGRTLLEAAASIGDPSKRYTAINQLIDWGIDVPRASYGQAGVMSILFSRSRHDADELVSTAVRLVEAGADTGRPYPSGDRTPSTELAYIQVPEDALSPLYDVWFARPDLALGRANGDGGNAVDLAEKLDRDDFVKRAKAWLEEHPEEKS
ncbi:hypothetical protein [Mariniluteicoccus flavus]